MGEMATRRGRYPAEVRERAVRLVFEHQGEHATQWAAIVSIAEKFGTSAETLRKWVRRAEVEDQLRRAIRGGELHGGTRMPSTRDLAHQLGVSRRIAVEPTRSSPRRGSEQLLQSLAARAVSRVTDPRLSVQPPL